MEEKASSSSANTCKFFIKKPNRANRNIKRKEAKSSGSSSSDEDTTIIASQRKSVKNPMIQSTNSFSMAKKAKITADNSSDEEPNDLYHVAFKSKKTTGREGPNDMGATSVVETETEKDKDAQSIFERAQKLNEDLKGKDDDNVYRGLQNYTQYITKKDTPQGNASSGFVRKGPVRAPENIRSTVRWDYQPDICKDYKETGFCGFGDSCKFLHDRSDYKAGWQIELEVAKGVYGQDDEDPDKYKIADDSDDLPFKCLICRKTFKCPVVTKCKHYFCEKCALDNYRKSMKCFVCGVQTMGVFNPAKEIIKRLKQDEEDGIVREDDDEDFEPIGEEEQVKEQLEDEEDDADFQ